MKINYNDPNSIYYQVHDVCTDIKDGLISDSEATENILNIVEIDWVARMTAEEIERMTSIKNSVDLGLRLTLNEFFDGIYRLYVQGKIGQEVKSV